MIRIGIALCIVACLSACATSPTGQPQLQLFPEEQMAEMGRAAYQDIKQQTPALHDPRANRYVACVVNALSDVVPGNRNWEVTVFQDQAINAFALPGGKVGVNTGLLRIVENQSQLAAVIGHEMAHVEAEHGNARVSTAYAAQAGLTLVQVLAGGTTSEKQQLLGLLGVGAQVGVLLPYGRAQESEADILGQEYMARAGFDPHESVGLWQNMARAGGQQPPEFLSTHPAHGTRIEQLRDEMPRALELYRQAQRQGKRPDCN